MNSNTFYLFQLKTPCFTVNLESMYEEKLYPWRLLGHLKKPETIRGDPAEKLKGVKKKPLLRGTEEKSAPPVDGQVIDMTNQWLALHKYQCFFYLSGPLNICLLATSLFTATASFDASFLSQVHKTNIWTYWDFRSGLYDSAFLHLSKLPQHLWPNKIR